MITLVSPKFLKQEAKKLKKILGISHCEALDEVSKKYGFSNYRHFLNFYEKSKLSKNLVLKSISLKNDMSKKIEFEIPCLENSQMSFHKQLEILKFFQDSDHVQAMCEKWDLMKDKMQSALFDEFLTEQGLYEIDFRHPYFIAKEISVSDLMYEIKGDVLCVDGDYDLKIKFDSEGFTLIEGSELIEFGSEVPDRYKEQPHFKERFLSGSFGIKIDMNKKIIIPHLNIVEIIDDTVYAGTLKPTARLIPAFRLE
jgi:hypothetical protein